MSDANDMDLMREYAARDSEAAFAGLVQRHINLVYSVALRFTGNSPDAQDVTQAVFIILAQKIASLRQRTTLTGWLYETTRFTARQLLRTRARQQAREQEAYMQSSVNDSDSENVWRQLAPLLEEAMARLSEKERTLVALRFFENKSAAETAALLGIQEWAAHKRAARAMEKLRQFFVKRGIASTTATLAGAISANSVQAAPAMLAKAVTTTAIAKGATASTSTLTLIKGALIIMAWSKTKTVIVVVASVLLAAGTAKVAVNKIKNHNDVVGNNGIVDKYPKPWTFAGRATPEDALRSFFAAQSQGDLQTVQDSYSAKSWAAIMDNLNAHPNDRDGFAASTSNNVKDVTVFYILKERKDSGGVFLSVKEDGGIHTNVWKMFMMKIGGEWKLATPGDSSDDAK